MSGLAGKTVVLGVTGGIAAYKAAEVCRLLIKAGASVRVVMTEAATRFIGVLTMQTLSGNKVGRDLLDADEEARIGHIRLGDEADIIVVAPATADTIARFAAGRADDLLAAVVLASGAPVLLAPAMNVNMWQNPITQQNLASLMSGDRFRTVGPDAGELACGWVGEGRLIEPAEVVAAAARLVTAQDMAGHSVVVTAGPTFEAIDDVRFIGNRSSGKMGFALAEIAARRGAEVTLIAGPVTVPSPPGPGITRIDVESAAEMMAALAPAAAKADVVVMAAAVADFRPTARTAGKISRRHAPGGRPLSTEGPASAGASKEDLATTGGTAGAVDATRGPALGASPGWSVPLTANPDLLAELVAMRAANPQRKNSPLLVGFAAEIGKEGQGALAPEELTARAKEKLADKGCDVIVANDVGPTGMGFGSDDNSVTVVSADGRTSTLPRAPKAEIAEGIWDVLVNLLPGRTFDAAGGQPGQAEQGERGNGAGTPATVGGRRPSSVPRTVARRTSGARGRRG